MSFLMGNGFDSECRFHGIPSKMMMRRTMQTMKRTRVSQSPVLDFLMRAFVAAMSASCEKEQELDEDGNVVPNQAS